MQPMDIERRSMEIIEAELQVALPEDIKPIVKRVIHATADFSFAESLHFTPGAVPLMREMLTAGATVITDTTMAKPLLVSSEKSFLFPLDLKQEDAESFKPETQKLNGAAIGVHNDGTEGGKSSSVIVIGSYEALRANYLSITSYNNAAYFVNLFNTLSDRDDVSIVIEGKDPSAKELGVTSLDAIAVPSILVRFVIPFGVLLVGLIIWIRRRHR